MTDRPASVSVLEWDSQHFGVHVARIGDDATDLAAAHGWCEDHGIDVVYFLTSADALDSEHHALSLGYRRVDLRLNFAMPAERWTCGPDASKVVVRETLESDLVELQAIARVSHRNTRFRADGRFDPARCDELYAAWVDNGFDAGGPMWTATNDGRTVGYLTGSIAATATGTEGRVGLIAVDDAARGLGAGRALVVSANQWFVQRGCAGLVVGTQGVNMAATNLYESLGYRLASIDVWHHWWRSTTAPRATSPAAEQRR